MCMCCVAIDLGQLHFIIVIPSDYDTLWDGMCSLCGLLIYLEFALIQIIGLEYTE